MRILTTVLEISRSEALTGRKQFNWFDLGELWPSWRRCTIRSPRNAAPLSCPIVRLPMPLFGHRQLLAQAISNLIENAIRYGASGGEIRVRVEPSECNIRVEVSDRGPGIPSERRDEALRRFGRLDTSRSDEGAGLGLALAKSIAHLHGGQLVLEDNRPGLVTVLVLPARAKETSTWTRQDCGQPLLPKLSPAPPRAD